MTVNVPRFKVTVNGTLVSGVDMVSVTEPCAYNVGKFNFTKAFTRNDSFPPAFWASIENKTLQVQIELSVDGQTFIQKMTGNVDSHAWEPIANKLTVVGRDLGSLLLDTRTMTTYRNLTSSEIAQKLAANHGLTAQVTNTSTLVGRYYDTDHDQTHGNEFSSAINEWDLLCRLGSKEGIIPYVQGNTLYFQDFPRNPPVFQASFTRDSNGILVSNITGLELRRNLVQAHDVIVTVRSWHSKKKDSFSSTVRTKTKTASADPNDQPTKYIYTKPNLTQAQCLAEAQRIAKDISQHERPVSVSIPSLQLLSPLHQLQVTGTETDYDTTYAVQGITYTIDAKQGAKTALSAKFSSPLSLYDEGTGQIIGEQA